MKTKLLAEISSLEQAIDFIHKDVDAIVLNIMGISLTKQFNLYTNELRILVDEAAQHKTELFVNIDRIYQQDDLGGLKVILKKLAEMNIKRIIVTDVGVLEYAKRLNLDFIFYNGNTTLNTNYGTMEFMSRYYQGFVLSNEININEVKSIVENNPSDSIVQIFGRVKTFYSQRHLLKSYLNFTKQPMIDISKNNLIVMDDESADDNRTYIYEDDFGTHAFTYYNVDGIQYLDQLQDLNLAYCYINNMFIDEEKYEDIALGFNSYFKGYITQEQLHELVKSHVKYLSTSFFEDQTVFTIEDARLLEGGKK